MEKRTMKRFPKLTTYSRPGRKIFIIQDRQKLMNRCSLCVSGARSQSANTKVNRIFARGKRLQDGRPLIETESVQIGKRSVVSVYKNEREAKSVWWEAL